MNKGLLETIETRDVTERPSPRERVRRRVRDSVLTGAWGVGDLLPTEEQISRQMGVSRNTVRAALTEVEQEGLIAGQGRRGRVVVGGGSEPSAVMADTAVILTALTPGTVPSRGGTIDVVEGAIAARASDASLNVMRIHFDRFNLETARWLVASAPRCVMVSASGVLHAEMTSMVALIRAANIPVVVNAATSELSDCDHVLFDHAEGARLLVDWLAKRGARRILPVFPTRHEIPWISERIRGYERGMRDAGLVPRPVVRFDASARNHNVRDEDNLQVRACQSLGFLYEAMTGAEPPDAIMVSDDALMYPVAMACRMAGWPLPAIAGYDNFAGICWEREDFGVPAVTVDKQNDVAGAEMFNLGVTASETGEPRTVVIPPKLIELTSPCKRMPEQ